MFRFRFRVRSIAVVAALVLAGCQGSSGTGGLTIPQPGAYGNPQGPASSQSVSRQQILAGTTEIDPATSQITLPTVAGFSIGIDVPSPSASTGAGEAYPRSTSSARPIASGSPAPAASPAVSSSPTASASPSPGASASADKAATRSHAAAKITTKLTIYPDSPAIAPTPTPLPSGSPLPAIIARTEIVRGLVQVATPVTFAGLAAVHVTVPAVEQLPNRGYTLAIFMTKGKKHQTLIAFDSAATLSKDTVRGASATPVTLQTGVEYAIELFGDPLPATPAPAMSTYPTPGNNPFSPPPGLATGMPGMPSGVATGYPAPGMTVAPAAGTTPTPYP